MQKFIALTILLSHSLLCYSFDCSPLEPRGGSNVDLDIKGSIDGKVKGAVAKMVGVNVDIDGAYRIIRDDTLKEYPNADQLYIWERFLYSNCEILNSSDLSDLDKLDRLDRLMDKMSFGPPKQDEFSFNIIETNRFPESFRNSDQALYFIKYEAVSNFDYTARCFADVILEYSDTLGNKAKQQKSLSFVISSYKRFLGEEKFYIPKNTTGVSQAINKKRCEKT